MVLTTWKPLRVRVRAVTLDVLEGFTIGITADRRWEQQADLFRRRGATVLHGPTMSTEYLGDSEALQKATTAVTAGVDYAVLTTGIGVRAWFEAAEAMGQGPALREALGRSKVLCRGPKAAAALQVAGVETAPVAISESLAELLSPEVLAGMRGSRLALQHHGSTDVAWPARLAQAGAEVLEVPVYRWLMPESRRPAQRLVQAVCDHRVDAVTFTSAPAVANLVQVASALGRRGPLLAAFNDGHVVAACVGPLCAAGAMDQGIAAPLAPDVGRLGLMVRMVTEALARRARRWVSGGRAVLLQGRAVVVGQERVTLSDTEARLLGLLAERPGVVVAKGVMARRLSTTPRSVEAGVGRLRQRLEAAGPPGADMVQTVPRRGYRLDCT